MLEERVLAKDREIVQLRKMMEELKREVAMREMKGEIKG
jgi:hypothetical protein